MALVTGKCKWGHDTPNLLDSVVNGKRVAATLCTLCLADLDPEIKRNAGRVMHPDRYSAWIAKKPV